MHVSDYDSKILSIEDKAWKISDKKLDVYGFEANGENNWKFYIKFKSFGSETTAEGTIKFDSAKDQISLENSGEDSFEIDGMFNTFVDKETMNIPEKFHGTWHACDVPECDKTTLIISSEKIGFGGKGEGCITDEATLEYAKIEVDKLKVKHSGLNSSGWSLFLAEDGENIIVSDGSDHTNGNFSKEEKKCSKKERKKLQAKKDCQEYIDCICELGEELADNSAYGRNIYKGQCRKAKSYLKSANGSACKRALKTFQKSFGQYEALYEAAGIDIPYACQE